jgi:hypothetical protein
MKFCFDINILMLDQSIIFNIAKEVELIWVKYYNKKVFFVCQVIAQDFEWIH